MATEESHHLSSETLRCTQSDLKSKHDDGPVSFGGTVPEIVQLVSIYEKHSGQYMVWMFYFMRGEILNHCFYLC